MITTSIAVGLGRVIVLPCHVNCVYVRERERGYNFAFLALLICLKVLKEERDCDEGEEVGIVYIYREKLLLKNLYKWPGSGNIIGPPYLKV